jgi:glycosyltransferase involved in cell wall biosynthesis
MTEPTAKIGIVRDFVEENWPSMELVPDMLAHFLAQESPEFSVAQFAPSMSRPFRALPWIGRSYRAFNADRLVSRLYSYPRWLRGNARGCDLYHVVDHTYANLVHVLPAGRTVVTCHDMGPFRCLFGHNGVSSAAALALQRGAAFRAMAGHILKGLQKAAWVICASRATRDELLASGAVSAEKTSVILNGVHPACVPEPDPMADFEVDRLIGPRPEGCIELLHVGSTVPRKRIDVLLNVFAQVRRVVPNVRLLRVGGLFTPEQAAQVEALGLRDSITVLPILHFSLLASAYRRATIMLQPSEDEGFGLPVIEALACGTPVVASEIPAISEVGGDAITFCPVGNIDQWCDAVLRLYRERTSDPQAWEQRRAQGFQRAAQFSWAEHARQVSEVYRKALGRSD